MPLSDNSNHLSSNQHKNKTKQQQVWCEDCLNTLVIKQDISKVKFTR